MEICFLSRNLGRTGQSSQPPRSPHLCDQFSRMVYIAFEEGRTPATWPSASASSELCAKSAAPRRLRQVAPTLFTDG